MSKISQNMRFSLVVNAQQKKRQFFQNLQTSSKKLFLLAHRISFFVDIAWYVLVRSFFGAVFWEILVGITDFPFFQVKSQLPRVMCVDLGVVWTSVGLCLGVRWGSVVPRLGIPCHQRIHFLTFSAFFLNFEDLTLFFQINLVFYYKNTDFTRKMTINTWETPVFLPLKWSTIVPAVISFHVLQLGSG